MKMQGRMKEYVQRRKPEILEDIRKNPVTYGYTSEAIQRIGSPLLEKMAENMATDSWRQIHAHDDISVQPEREVWCGGQYIFGARVDIGGTYIRMTRADLMDLYDDIRQFFIENP
jgi:hypothetical protein